VISPNDVRHLEAVPILETPDPRDVQYLDDRIYEYNVARTGIADARLLAIILRDDDGRIVAGLHGWTWGRSCEVRTLWVHERWRGQRLGTRLLEAAELEACERGAVQLVLSTHDFQAPEFYRRLGFDVVGRVEDHPVGFRSIYLRKRLG
jgi:N-acetylglutamate synthase-like GNAT family acetyltransferase